MNIGVILRALDNQGEYITLRRMAGSARIPFDVKILAWVQVGAATLLIGGVQTTADKIITTSVQLEEVRWPGVPRHGDTIIYGDGRTSMVQGRADSVAFDGEIAYIMTVLGAQ
jgi:acyl dehydratase